MHYSSLKYFSICLVSLNFCHSTEDLDDCILSKFADLKIEQKTIDDIVYLLPSQEILNKNISERLGMSIFLARTNLDEKLGSKKFKGDTIKLNIEIAYCKYELKPEKDGSPKLMVDSLSGNTKEIKENLYEEIIREAIVK